MGARAVAGVVLLLTLSACPGRPAWLRSQDLTYGTAHTLEEGRYEIGLFTPFQYGISERVSAAIHPVLFFVVPSLSVRWRFIETDTVALATNLGATWSFIGREDADGDPVDDDADCTACGFPGLTLWTGTATFEPAKGWLLSVGGGPAIDFLDLKINRVVGELHASVLWHIDRDNLLMLHGNTYIDGRADQPLVRPTLQLTFAHDWDGFVGAIGVAVGEFPIRLSDGTLQQWPAYPVVDLLWRL